MPRSMKLTRLLAVAAALAGGTVRAAAQEVPHETFTMHSSALNETRRINVYTPPGYQPRGPRFPVLYMPDGGMQEDFPHVVATVDSAIRAGQMRPVLVVGIENTERRRDMTGPTEVADDRKIAVHVGGSAAFRRFIARELMPEVRHRYRVTGEKAIIGESLAGLFIMETFFLQPKLFDTYIALSPSLWWNHGALVDSAAALLRARPKLRAALYFSSASDDIGEPIIKLDQVMRANAPPGLHWEYRHRPDLKHSTTYLGESPRVLREWLPPRTSAPAHGGH
jgi:predicted alpha/beta superfamily hydrolase